MMTKNYRSAITQHLLAYQSGDISSAVLHSLGVEPASDLLRKAVYLPMKTISHS